MKNYNLNEVRSQVMSLAWKFIKFQMMNKSEAMRLAWMNVNLKRNLFNRTCVFNFKKADGTVRHAVGTMTSDVLAKIQGKREASPAVTVFYDKEKESFRSFRKERLLSIEK